MSPIGNTQSFIVYFEQAMRQQFEVQETEMREQLKMQEIEIYEVKTQRTDNDRIVAELKPLCEEVPHDALDPVTFEPLDEAMVTQCCHTFNRSTLVDAAAAIGGIEEVHRMKGMPCPICRWKFHPHSGLFPCGSVRNMVQIFKQISEVFKRNSQSQ